MKKHFLKAAVLTAVLSITGCSSDDSSPTCPNGYQGPNCDAKITPSKIKINKVVIRSFPIITNDLKNWDNGEDTSGSLPDIFFILSNLPQVLKTSDFVIDAEIGSDPTYVMSPPVEINNVLSEYQFGLYDYDGGSIADSQNMAVGTVKFYNPDALTFPEIYTVSGQGLIVDFHLTYEW